MKPYSLILGLFLLAQVLQAQQSGNSQYLQKFQNGCRFYQENRMYEAASQFRGAQEAARNANDWSQAVYWVILTELALGDYGSAIRDMDELERITPKSSFAKDMVYHRARAYYNQGYFEDALYYFKRYNDSIVSDDNSASDRKAASFFWMGECLYSMGQLNDAERFYSWVVAKYPNSPKFEVSSYRIDLIKQKKIEAELLSLLRWSHEESLKNSEDYQRRIRTYENTINTYQRRIAELNKGVDPVIIEEMPSPVSEPDEIYNNGPDDKNSSFLK